MSRIHWLTFANTKSTHVRAKYFQNHWPRDFQVAYHFLQDNFLLKKINRRVRNVIFTILGAYIILRYKNEPIILQKYPPKLLILLLPILRRNQIIYETDDSTWQPNIYSKYFFKKITKNCKFIIVENQNQAEYIRNNFPGSNTMIWPTPIQSEFKNRKAEKCSIFTIIWIGSASTSQGIFHLIPIFNILGEYNFPYKLILLGIDETVSDILKIRLPQVDFELIHSYSMEECFWYMSKAHVGIYPNNHLSNDYFRGDHKIRIYLSAGLKVIADSIYRSQLTLNEVQKDVIWVDSKSDWLEQLVYCYRNRNEQQNESIWIKEDLGKFFSRKELISNFISSWCAM